FRLREGARQEAAPNSAVLLRNPSGASKVTKYPAFPSDPHSTGGTANHANATKGCARSRGCGAITPRAPVSDGAIRPGMVVPLVDPEPKRHSILWIAAAQKEGGAAAPSF